MTLQHIAGAVSEVYATMLMARLHYVQLNKIDEWYRTNFKSVIEDPKLMKGLVGALRTRSHVKAHVLANLLETDTNKKEI